MRLSGLLDALQDWCDLVSPAGGQGVDPVLTGVCSDSREIVPGDLFLALPGLTSDGMDYASEAVSSGARVVLSAAPGTEKVPYLIPKGSLSLAELAGQVAHVLTGRPSDSLFILGVTGTNGKTTVVHLVHQVLEAASIPTGRCGTLGRFFRGTNHAQNLTTPPVDTLQAWFSEVFQAGGRAVALEASSHGLSQCRLAGVSMDAAGWTNLTQDHLDYHSDIASYAKAKAGLIHALPAGSPAFVPLGEDRILAPCQGALAEIIPWGLGDRAPLRGKVEFHAEGLILAIEGSWGGGEIRSSLVGRHNAENLLLAWGLSRSVGLSEEEASRGLSDATSPIGRLERIRAGGNRFLYVDYAHTPAALEEVLAAIRASHPSKQLGLVFGAGGDRDSLKRFPMGVAAAQGADWCIVTTDNARMESPVSIAEAVADGVRSCGVEPLVELDRRSAIRMGLKKTAPGDVLVVAGKGHETWQNVGGVRFPFSDKVELEEAVGCLI